MDKSPTPGSKVPPLTLRIAVGSTNPCKIDAVRIAFEHVFARSRRGDCISCGYGDARHNPETSQNNATSSNTNDSADNNINGPSIQRNVNIIMMPFNVPSGVSDQPFGDIETRQGAMNRARAAYDAAIHGQTQNQNYDYVNNVQKSKGGGDGDQIHVPDIPDFAVGIEGGLEKAVDFSEQRDLKQRQPNTQSQELWCMAWLAILGNNNNTLNHEKKNDNTKTMRAAAAKTVGSENCISWGYAKTASFLLPPSISYLVLDQNMELGHADDKIFQRVNSKHGSGTVGILTDGEIDRKDYYIHALKLALIPWVRPGLYLGDDSAEQQQL